MVARGSQINLTMSHGAHASSVKSLASILISRSLLFLALGGRFHIQYYTPFTCPTEQHACFGYFTLYRYSSRLPSDFLPGFYMKYDIRNIQWRLLSTSSPAQLPTLSLDDLDRLMACG